MILCGSHGHEDELPEEIVSGDTCWVQVRCYQPTPDNQKEKQDVEIVVGRRHTASN